MEEIVRRVSHAEESIGKLRSRLLDPTPVLHDSSVERFHDTPSSPFRAGKRFCAEPVDTYSAKRRYVLTPRGRDLSDSPMMTEPFLRKPLLSDSPFLKPHGHNDKENYPDAFMDVEYV